MLLLGDCVERLKEIPDASIDSVVTDPPYGLSKEPDIVEVLTHWLANEEYEHKAKGFMGRNWDSFVPGPEVWREVFRVMKPGAHLAAFGGTRTYDLLVVAIRMAGFEIRDQLSWMYGCLDEQTEAVTAEGVKPYHQVKEGELVLCYDVATGMYSYQPVSEVVVYDYADTAYRLVGDFGEQVVSRNHRCIVERGGREVFSLAETLQREARVPFLENLPALQQAVRYEWTAQGVRARGGHNPSVVRVVPFHLVGKVWCLRVPTGAFVAVRNGVAFPTGNSGFPKSMDVSKALDKAAGAQRQVTGISPATRQGKRSSAWAQIRNDSSSGVYGEKKTIYTTASATDQAKQWEGWGTALKPAQEPIVWARKPLTPVPEYVAIINVIHHQIGVLLWLMFDAKRARRLLQSSSPERIEGCASALVNVVLATSQEKPGKTGTFSSLELESTALSIVTSWNAILAVLYHQRSTSITSTASSTTTVLRTLKSLLAPVTSLTTMPPCGCLRDEVPLPARSVEKVSSGDWLSWLDTLRVSVPETAIGPIALTVESALADVAVQLSGDQGEGSIAAQSATTKTDENLCPRHEPIVLARKPLIGTVAANVVEHGTGGMNIDGCRIGIGADKGVWPVTDRQGRTALGSFNKNVATDHTQGRWPANVLLSHDEQCELRGTKRVKRVKTGTAVQRNGGGQKIGGASGIYGGSSPVARPDQGYAIDGKEAVEDWDCVRTCPVRMLDEQSGLRTSGSGAVKRVTGAENEGNRYGRYGKESRVEGTEMVSYADKGGASRFYYCAKTAKKERNLGCEDLYWEVVDDGVSAVTRAEWEALPKDKRLEGNCHTTVKPLALMQWLVRLVTPPGGKVLDPFVGSGTSVVAAKKEGFDFVGIELEEPSYMGADTATVTPAPLPPWAKK